MRRKLNTHRGLIKERENKQLSLQHIFPLIKITDMYPPALTLKTSQSKGKGKRWVICQCDNTEVQFSGNVWGSCTLLMVYWKGNDTLHTLPGNNRSSSNNSRVVCSPAEFGGIGNPPFPSSAIESPNEIPLANTLHD